MGKKVLKPVGMVVIALILLVLIFMLRGSLRGPARVVLPEETANGENISGADDGENDAINRVDIRPSTVQAVSSRLRFLSAAAGPAWI